MGITWLATKEAPWWGHAQVVPHRANAFFEDAQLQVFLLVSQADGFGVGGRVGDPLREINIGSQHAFEFGISPLMYLATPAVAFPYRLKPCEM